MFLILFLLEAKGLIIEKVQLKGNRFLKEASNLPLFSQPKREVSDSLINLDREQILKFYTENGFLNTEVFVKKIVKGNKVNLIFEIKEGKRVKYKWSGIPANLPIPIKEVVSSEGEIEVNINQLLEYYANQGRPFARITPRNFRRQEDTIFYDLFVSEGHPIWLDNISFAGNLTREGVLKKFLSLPLPFLFSERKIKSRIRRLTRERENPIEFKGLEIISQDGGYNLKIHLKEPARQELGLLLTYLPRDKRVAGLFSLTLPNLFYTRRMLKIQWERERNFLKYFFSYAEPLFLFAQKAKITFANKTYDTLEAKTNIETAFAFLTPQEFLTLSFVFGYEKIIEKRERDVRFSHLGQELIWESREGILPKSGQYFSLYSYFGNRKEGERKGIKSGLRLKGTIIFNLRKVFPNFSFLGEGIFTDTILEQEKTHLGGRERLRGFKEEELLSSFVFLLRQDWKLPLGNGFFYPFFDFGVRKKESGYEGKSSFGFGLEIIFKNSYLEFIYGIPSHQNLLSGRIHLLTKFGF